MDNDTTETNPTSPDTIQEMAPPANNEPQVPGNQDTPDSPAVQKNPPAGKPHHRRREIKGMDGAGSDLRTGFHSHTEAIDYELGKLNSYLREKEGLKQAWVEKKIHMSYYRRWSRESNSAFALAVRWTHRKKGELP